TIRADDARAGKAPHIVRVGGRHRGQGVRLRETAMRWRLESHELDETRERGRQPVKRERGPSAPRDPEQERIGCVALPDRHECTAERTRVWPVGTGGNIFEGPCRPAERWCRG